MIVITYQLHWVVTSIFHFILCFYNKLREKKKKEKITYFFLLLEGNYATVHLFFEVQQGVGLIFCDILKFAFLWSATNFYIWTYQIFWMWTSGIWLHLSRLCKHCKVFLTLNIIYLQSRNLAIRLVAKLHKLYTLKVATYCLKPDTWLIYHFYRRLNSQKCQWFWFEGT